MSAYNKNMEKVNKNNTEQVGRTADWESLKEIPFAGDLYRKKAFGHIAITNALKSSVGPYMQEQSTQDVGGVDVNASTPVAGTYRSVPVADTKTIDLHEPDDETLCRQFLKVIGENAETMNLFMHSDEIEFFLSLARIFRDRVEAVEYPYFAVDLFILIKAWGEEGYNKELIDDYYVRRLVGIIRSYGYLG